MRKHKLFFQFWVIFLESCFLISCNSVNSQPIVTQNINTQIPESPMVFSTESLPTSTIVPTTHTPLPTLIPTLDVTLARQRVIGLFETNNGCQLPCWWGIIPGKTKWEDALEILVPISLKMEPYFLKRQNESIYVNVISPNEELYGGYLEQTYQVDDGIVTEIALLSNHSLATLASINTILQEHGLPPKIYIHGFSEPYLDNWPFQIALFYPSQGMLLEYSGEPEVKGDNIRLCWDDSKSAIIHLWTPAFTFSFDEAITRSYPKDQINYWPYKAVDETINNPQEFLNNLTDVQNPHCFETPRAIWPSQ